MATLVSDLILEAYCDAGVIATTGEAISATLQADALRLLNQMWQSWMLDPLMQPQHFASFALVANTDNYTLGPGGSWDTTGFLGATGVPLAISSWDCRSGSFRTGGKPIPLPQFREEVNDGLGASAVLIQKLAHTGQTQAPIAIPTGITVYVFPRPATSPGTVFLQIQWAQVTAFAATDDISSSMLGGYFPALHYNLAIMLNSIYPRPGGVPEATVANARNFKIAIMNLNASILGVAPPQ